jgi:hypothetical protein
VGHPVYILTHTPTHAHARMLNAKFKSFRCSCFSSLPKHLLHLQKVYFSWLHSMWAINIFWWSDVMIKLQQFCAVCCLASRARLRLATDGSSISNLEEEWWLLSVDIRLSWSSTLAVTSHFSLYSVFMSSGKISFVCLTTYSILLWQAYHVLRGSNRK